MDGVLFKRRVAQEKTTSVLQEIYKLVPINMERVTMDSSVRMPDKENVTDQRCSWCRVICTRLWKFFSAYGAIFAYYGSALGGLGSSIIVTIVNE